MYETMPGQELGVALTALPLIIYIVYICTFSAYCRPKIYDPRSRQSLQVQVQAQVLQGQGAADRD